MARIDPGPTSTDEGILEVFRHQTERWGRILKPYLVYARRPSIFKAVVGMWNGLSESGLLDDRLLSLVNRRVASLNGCVF